MEKYPLVSVCMPVYNAEKYIEQAVGSALEQTYDNIEIIIVNDGSTDGTAQILEPFQNNKKIKIIHQKNRGQCAAANGAFIESKGEYIKFFDADDILSPQFIELQVNKLKGYANHIASAEWGRFYHDDPGTFKLNPEEVWQDMDPMDWLVTSMQNGPNMMQCALWLIPRKVLEKSGVWDERLSLINDFEFMIRVILHSEGICFTPGARLYYRSGIAEGTLSGQKSRKAMESAWLSTDLGCSYILNKENTPQTRRICANMYQLWAYNFYPFYPDLTSKAEKKVRALSGSDYPLPGGKNLKMLSKFIGWKKAKQLHHFAYQLGHHPKSNVLSSTAKSINK